MLLCRTGLYPANQVKPRAAIFCPAVAHTSPLLLQKLLCPCSRTGTIILPDFTRSLSADTLLFKQHSANKERKGLPENAGQGVWPVGGRIFPAWFIHYCLFSMVFMKSLRLVFGYFLIKQKVTGLRGQERGKQWARRPIPPYPICLVTMKVYWNLKHKAF
jgi:hypothetical protein